MAKIFTCNGMDSTMFVFKDKLWEKRRQETVVKVLILLCQHLILQNGQWPWPLFEDHKGYLLDHFRLWKCRSCTGFLFSNPRHCNMMNIWPPRQKYVLGTRVLYKCPKVLIPLKNTLSLFSFIIIFDFLDHKELFWKPGPGSWNDKKKSREMSQHFSFRIFFKPLTRQS